MVGPVLLLLGLVLPVPPAARAPDDAAALRAQVKEILERGDYQQALPDEGDEPEAERGRRGSGPGFAISPAAVLVTVGAVLLVLLVLGMQRHDGTAETRRAGGA